MQFQIMFWWEIDQLDDYQIHIVVTTFFLSQKNSKQAKQIFAELE